MSMLVLSAGLLCWFRPAEPLLPEAAGVIAEGRAQLERVEHFASQPRYGECWSAALRRVDVGCKDFNEETQSRIALAFAHCHLQRSARSFPLCAEGSSVQDCTRHMDALAFSTYTEFFTHAHSICYFLQSEAWQLQAENTVQRLTENSAHVALQLEATNRLAERMVEAQNATLRSQEEILQNGDALKQTLQDSSQGVKQVFAEMQQSASEQRLVFSEIFNRVSFLHSFVVSESHTLYSLLYNLLALGAVFIVTATQRTAGARLFLFCLVALNVYLERLICHVVLESTEPGYEQAEQLSFLVGLLRRSMVLFSVLVLVYTAVRYRDLTRESVEILRQLRETQSNLQEVFRQAERLTQSMDVRMCQRGKEKEEETTEWDGDVSVLSFPRYPAETSSLSSDAQSSVWLQSVGVRDPVSPSQRRSVGDSAPVSPSRRRSSVGVRDPVSPSRRRSVGESAPVSPSRTSRRQQSHWRHVSKPAPSALVYSILVEDEPAKPRYNLRNRQSLPGPLALQGLK
ncbi:uncharacterized protein LOC131723409 [Acipenser ruthenus]|uniref:uncharacterized protein LOC131723409 n=1 Tax=Acipenser ruthenus TaxID=7906 RepID=UPI002741DE0D|nr:uncharacterized protein LOC131723409 [Acipenser ruthenus]XP_058873165.1 uncharacterized protein LOC131723409 [Acipenser ruthenus]